MRVLLAESMGMCFGVRDALKIIDKLERPEHVTIHGQLVHNETVLVQLGRRGFHMADEAERAVPETEAVLITAHGISETERRQLEDAGKRLIDTTCPLVRRVHQAACKLQSEGFHVIVIGKKNHVEVRGIIGDLHTFDVVESADEIRTWPARCLGVISQTTMPTRLVGRILQRIHIENSGKEIRFVDTVCQPTKDRQKALEQLLSQVDAMVVVGGRNSNNTKELAARCAERGVPVHHVQGAADLQGEWFDGCRKVGLTAGTSTLEETINEVHEALLEVGATASRAKCAV